MKPFSEQIRDAINASGVSRYALAEQTGVSESALSRFMSGKQSMSLATLDKVAGALGLHVIVAVSGVKKSRKPGRPKKEKPKMKTLKKLTKSEWDMMAARAAQEAHDENFASRRGLYIVEEAGIVYYDNNPFKLPRESDPREELIAEFRKFLKRSNLKEKAAAYWPVSGDEKDYTFAMVIQTEEFMLQSIQIAFQSIVNSFMRGMRENRDN